MSSSWKFYENSKLFLNFLFNLISFHFFIDCNLFSRRRVFFIHKRIDWIEMKAVGENGKFLLPTSRRRKLQKNWIWALFYTIDCKFFGPLLGKLWSCQLFSLRLTFSKILNKSLWLQCSKNLTSAIEMQESEEEKVSAIHVEIIGFIFQIMRFGQP